MREDKPFWRKPAGPVTERAVFSGRTRSAGHPWNRGYSNNNQLRAALDAIADGKPWQDAVKPTNKGTYEKTQGKHVQ